MARNLLISPSTGLSSYGQGRAAIRQGAAKWYSAQHPAAAAAAHDELQHTALNWSSSQLLEHAAHVASATASDTAAVRKLSEPAKDVAQVGAAVCSAHKALPCCWRSLVLRIPAILFVLSYSHLFYAYGNLRADAVLAWPRHGWSHCL